MEEKRKYHYSREDRAERRETMGWNPSKTFYHSFEFPLWVVGKPVLVRGYGRTGIIKAVSEKPNGGWYLNEFTYTVRFDDGTIAEGIFESQIISA